MGLYLKDIHLGEAKKSEEAIGKSFRRWLLEEYGRGTLDAGQVCIICWYAVSTKGAGVEDLKLEPQPPSQQSNFQKKLDKALDLERIVEKLYPLELPSCDKHSGRRTVPPHLTHSIFTQSQASRVETKDGTALCRLWPLTLCMGGAKR